MLGILFQFSINTVNNNNEFVQRLKNIVSLHYKTVMIQISQMTSSRSFFMGNFNYKIILFVIIFVDYVQSGEECGPNYVLKESKDAPRATTLLGALHKVREKIEMGNKTLPLNESITFSCIKP